MEAVRDLMRFPSAAAVVGETIRTFADAAVEQNQEMAA
jgi:hypothetical protein